MMRNFKGVAVLTIAVMLTGCSFLSPVQAPPEMGYVINQKPGAVKTSRTHQVIMMVLKPETSPAYNTTRLAFTTHPFQISYYSSSHWAEVPADMFAPLIADTLQKTKHYRAIITPPFTGQYNYALRTQINELLVDYTAPMAVMRLSLQGQILSGSTGNVISSRQFNVAVPLDHRTPYSAVIAANRAASIALGEMAAWSVRHTQ